MMIPDEGGEDRRAAELALGVLEGEELAAARRDQLADPDFAAAVEAWQRRFAGLLGSVPGAEPPPQIEDRVMRAAAVPAAGVSPLWRWATAAASAVAACLLAALLLAPERVRVVLAPAPPPPLVAALAPEAAKPFGAIYDPARGQVRLADGVAVPEDRVAELWVIGGDGVPHSLGLLRRAGSSAILVVPAERRRIDAGATLAISVEPAGGSRTGKPTGPVVATGALFAI